MNSIGVGLPADLRLASVDALTSVIYAQDGDTQLRRFDECVSELARRAQSATSSGHGDPSAATSALVDRILNGLAAAADRHHVLGNVAEADRQRIAQRYEALKAAGGSFSDASLTARREFVLDVVSRAMAAQEAQLLGVSHALESLVDTDLAHDDPAYAAHIVAQMVDTLAGVARRARTADEHTHEFDPVLRRRGDTEPMFECACGARVTLDGLSLDTEQRALAERRPQSLEDDLIEFAWTLIAHAGGGDWSRESRQWQAAATRWRDRFIGPEGTRAVPLPT